MSAESRVQSAMSRARSEIEAAQRLEAGARRARGKADEIARVHGFYIGADEVGTERCEKFRDGFRCLHVAGHEGECL